MPARPILVALLCAALGASLWWSASAAADAGNVRWNPPVPGPPSRLFDLGPDPFARGQHRGVDLAAAPGEQVRSACAGRVVFAGRVAREGTVSVRCGAWRVSYAPLERIAVRAGARVGPGRGLGRIAGEALQFGVRREGRRFGYVDPLRFLSGPRRAPPPVVAARPPRAAPGPRRAPPPVVAARPPRAAPRPQPAPRPSRPSPGLAPWPVWVGLALLMTGLAGVGTLRLPVQPTGGAACRASSTSSSSPTTLSSP